MDTAVLSAAPPAGAAAAAGVCSGTIDWRLRAARAVLTAPGAGASAAAGATEFLLVMRFETVASSAVLSCGSLPDLAPLLTQAHKVSGRNHGHPRGLIHGRTQCPTRVHAAATTTQHTMGSC